jgi:hypothetical protein
MKSEQNGYTFPLKRAFRLTDFDNYIRKSSIINKSNDTCLLILTYNNLESLQRILNNLINYPIDLLVVDNNSVDNSYNVLTSKYVKRINTISLNENIGGAGGYAVGQEWVLDRGYKYCLITEDDAECIDEDLILEMLSKASENRIVQCRYDGLYGQLFTLHFTLYPCSIFEHAGVMNANLFFRYDDFEYGLRLQKHASSNRFEAICIDKKYKHPFLKRGFGVLPTYFMIRNCLVIYSSIGKPFVSYKMLFINVVFSIYSFLSGHGHNFFYMILHAIKDFFFFRKRSNHDIFNKFKALKIQPNIDIDLKETSINDFNIKFSKYTILTGLKEHVNLKMSNVKNGFLIRNVVVGKFSMPTSIFSAIAKRTVFIESINLTTQTLEYWEYTNTSRIIKSIKLFLSILFSLLIFIPLSPFIIFCSLYFYLVARSYYPRPLTIKLFKRKWDSMITKL